MATQDGVVEIPRGSPGSDAGGMTRWLVLVGAIVVQLILGTVYGYSIFWTPLMPKVFSPVLTQAEASRLAAEGQAPSAGATIVENEEAAAAQRGRQEGLLKYAFSICYIAFAGVMLFAGRVQDIKGPRFTAMIGAALMGAGFLAAGTLLGDSGPARSPTTKLVILWSTTGLLAGAGIGFAYVCPIAALIKWFPRQKGLVSGLAVAGFGFGAYVFAKGKGPIGALSFIHKYGIERFFLIHGLVCLVAISLGALLLRNPPGTPRIAHSESTWQQTLRRPAFYVLWLMFFSGTLVGLMVIGIAANFAGEQIVKMHTGGVPLDKAAIAELMGKGAAAVGWLAIFNATGRIVWGLVSDRVGRTAALVTNFTMQAIVMVLLARMNTEWSLVVALCLVGFNYGGSLSMFPSATADLFGAKNLGANYAWVFTCNAFSGMVGVAIGNLSKARTGSYETAFVMAACMCVLSAALAIGLRLSQKRAAATAPQG